jgi:TetR/AcrR family transcriptional regulator
MTNKTGTKKELVQRFRTEGILEAARRVIARRGLDKATMEQVAEEAGISKATIYLYFRNKEALYFHCVMDRFDEVLTSMKDAVRGVDDPIDKIEALVTAQIKAIESDKDFFRVFLTERMGIFLELDTEFGQEFSRRHGEFTKLLSGALEEGMDRGLLRKVDPVKAFSLLFSMVRGMAMCKILYGEDAPLSSETGLILDVFFNGLKAG